ncbi:MAG: response regulator [Planctomycetes bacterium]|nr:response regulator [Planctomycetota bacterium]
MRSLDRDLTRHGYEVLTAGSARQALESVSRFRPSLALVDIMMPGMDGLELADKLSHRKSGAIPVVLLTALDSEETVYQGFSRGARYLIHKTREADKLLDVVDFFVGDLSDEEREALKTKL